MARSIYSKLMPYYCRCCFKFECKNLEELNEHRDECEKNKVKRLRK